MLNLTKFIARNCLKLFASVLLTITITTMVIGWIYLEIFAINNKKWALSNIIINVSKWVKYHLISKTQCKNWTVDVHGHVIGLLNILNQNFRIKTNHLNFSLTLYKLKL